MFFKKTKENSEIEGQRAGITLRRHKKDTIKPPK